MEKLALLEEMAAICESFLAVGEKTSANPEGKAGLSATAQVQGDEAGPSVSDLAQKIKPVLPGEICD